MRPFHPVKHCQQRNRNAAGAVFVVVGFALALVVGCAQTPSKDRDLNAEAMRQMSYWGGEPGF